MGIEMDISQVVGYSSRLRRAGGRVGALGAKVFRKTVFDIESDAKVLIVQYDAVDTGNMLGSVSSTITGDGRGRMDGEIGPTADYSIHVHDGTSVMPGRPFLTDAFDRRLPGFEAALQKIAESDL